MIATLARPYVICHLHSMYIMFHLLCNHGKMSGLIELITSTTVFVSVMIFQCQARIGRRAHECAGTKSLRLQLRHLCVAVSVMVVAISISALTIDENSRLVIIGHNRGIQGRIIVERSGRTDGCQRM